MQAECRIPRVDCDASTNPVFNPEYVLLNPKEILGGSSVVGSWYYYTSGTHLFKPITPSQQWVLICNGAN